MANGFVLDGDQGAIGDGQQGLPGANIAFAQKFIVPGSGTYDLDAIGIWGDGSGGIAEFMMSAWTFDAVNDCPQALVTNADSGDNMSLSGTGTNNDEYALTDAQVIGGDEYMICLLTKDVNLDVDRDSAGGGDSLSINHSSYAWPTPTEWESHTNRTWNFSVYAIYSAAAAGITVDCTLGTIVIAGLNPSILEGIDVSCTLGTLVIVGLDLNISEGIDVECILGTVNIASLDLDISAGVNVECTLGTLVIAGLSADVSEGIVVECTLGQVTISGLDLTIATGVIVEVSTGSVIIEGYNVSVEIDIEVDCTLGQIVISGLNTDVVSTTVIDVGTGSIEIVGLVISIQTGSDAPLERTIIMEMDSKDYDIENESKDYDIELENKTYIVT